jgi:hypothetical protein
MKTLKDVVDRLLTRLEDLDNVIWTRSEVEGYVKSGYDNLTRTAKCLWDMTYAAEDVTYCANHVAAWEELYMDDVSGFLTLGIFNMTGGTGTPNPPLWEQQYFDNGVGPCNHTNTWEDSYTFNDFFLSTAQLPANTIDVDRVTFDNYRIDPRISRDMNDNYTYYEYIQGPQRGYTLDKDGYFTIRKVPVPEAKGDTFSFTGSWGLQRSQTASEFETNPTVIGDYGVLRSMPLHFPLGGDGFGFPRRVYRDTKNFKVEYIRRGRDLDSYTFEIPDRYVKYVELYAMSLAREREGDGQNKQLADHFMMRYQKGIQRLIERRELASREYTHRMGGGGNTTNNWPDLAKLPYHYPQVPR